MTRTSSLPARRAKALLQLKRAAVRLADEVARRRVSWEAQFGYDGLQCTAERYAKLLAPAERKRLGGKL